jgi:uncharacterized protein YjbJ (UPF0337 family)
MGEKTDKATGRIKEATGILTGDDKLRREGKVDQAAGKAKGAAEKVKDAATNAIDGVRDAIRGKH